MIQAIRVVGRVRGITPSRVGRVRISVSRVRGITLAAVVDLLGEHPSRAGQTDAAGPLPLHDAVRGELDEKTC